MRGRPPGKYPAYKCGRHVRGTAPGQQITFEPRCGKCLELRDLGKMTGNEPPPLYGTESRYSQNAWNMRMNRLKGLAKKAAV